MISLDSLRRQTGNAVRAEGYIVEASDNNQMAGRCHVICQPLQDGTGVNLLQVTQTDTGNDWYVPYTPNEARSVLVPFGEPHGTIILTHGMNGCALEIRREEGGNRIFHDADGCSMEAGETKFRITAEDYMDRFNRELTKLNERHTDFISDEITSVNLIHTIICIKEGHEWGVYNNCVSSVYKFDEDGVMKSMDAWHVKDHLTYKLGSFPDL